MQFPAAQAAALAKPVAGSFDARALAFLAEEFPLVAQQAQAGRLAKFVELGHDRAVAHGFASEREIVQYLVLMLYLGPLFDEDPHFATLRPLLDPASPMNPAWRLNVLTRAALRQPEPGHRDGR